MLFAFDGDVAATSGGSLFILCEAINQPSNNPAIVNTIRKDLPRMFFIGW